MRVEMLQSLMNDRTDRWRRPMQSAQRTAADFPRTARQATPGTQPCVMPSTSVVSAADAVAISRELAQAQKMIAALRQENAMLRSALARGSASASAAGGAARAAAQAQRAAPRQAPRPVPRASQATVEVPAATSPSAQAASVPVQPGVVSVEVEAPEAPRPSAEDVAWYGEHLRGSEPADFSDYESIDAELGLV